MVRCNCCRVEDPHSTVFVGIHYKCQQDTHNRRVAETKGVAEPTVYDTARRMKNVIDVRSSSVF
jgi:hypothetical protein